MNGRDCILWAQAPFSAFHHINFTENLISFTRSRDHATSRGARRRRAAVGVAVPGSHAAGIHTRCIVAAHARVRRADVCRSGDMWVSVRSGLARSWSLRVSSLSRHCSTAACVCANASCSLLLSSPLLSSPLQALLRAPPGSLMPSVLPPPRRTPPALQRPLTRARGAHPSARRRGRVPIHTCRHARASQPALARGRVPGARAVTRAYAGVRPT